VSLYRQPGRVRPLLIAGIAVAALAVGLALGFALGRSGREEPSARQLVASLRSTLRPLAAGLELLPTEYPQARAGAGNESAAVRGDLARIDAALHDAAPRLRALDPASARTLADRVAAVRAGVRADVPPARLERLAAAAQDALAAVPGGR
jgi:hypothetical protein